MDDGDHDDAHDNCHEGGPQVICHSQDAQAAGGLGIQGGEARHQAGRVTRVRSTGSRPARRSGVPALAPTPQPAPAPSQHSGASAGLRIRPAVQSPRLRLASLCSAPPTLPTVTSQARSHLEASGSSLLCLGRSEQLPSLTPQVKPSSASPLW